MENIMDNIAKDPNIDDTFKNAIKGPVKTYDTIEAHEEQTKYCEEKKAPHFAPHSNCYSCGRNIYAEGGISVEEARESLITGCPFCHRSYCE